MSDDSGCGGAIGRNTAEFTKSSFWKALLAEFLGTLLLVFIGCASCVRYNLSDPDLPPPTADPTDTPLVKCLPDGNHDKIVQISLTFGLAVATIVWGIAHVSGGHINPAVTMGMLLARKITVVRAVLYIVMQSVGAVAGAALLRAVNPSYLKNDLCNTGVSENISSGQAFGVEFIITFVLVFTVFASCDKKRKDLAGSAPLTIGLSVTLCHLAAIKYSGASMNPARSFGTAAVLSEWDNHWVYWCGPIFGGVVAGVLYDLLFAADSSVEKLKHMFRASDPESYEFESKFDNNNNNNNNINNNNNNDDEDDDDQDFAV